MFQETKVSSMYNMDRSRYFNDKNLNREQRRALEKAYKLLIQTYPDTLEKVPENDPNVPYSSHPEDIKAIFRSKKYTVILYKMNKITGRQRFSITRNEWSSKERRYVGNISWDEIMEIKRQIGLGDVECWEYYPKDSEIINEANMRHIFFD